ncbi:MAG TPA: MCE family protein [Nocardioidaceae bacterium]|nr:MCE family protein [Nocardioidaceae bacterium]
MSTLASTRKNAAKLVVFLVVSLVATLFLAATIRPWGSSGQRSYRAELISASRLAHGDEVRVAGVVVGRISEVAVTEDSHAVVTFSVDGDLELTEDTHAAVRYLDLVGGRYLSLSQGSGTRLREGGTIAMRYTEPALDLDDLFNGFKPLFAALSPDDVNELAANIIATLQGEGSTVEELLAHTADLTSTLADRDEVLGRVVTNLNQVLRTVDDRQVQLEGLVVQLTRFVSGLSEDRTAIGDSIAHIDAMAEVTSSLLHDARPDLETVIAQLGHVAASLNSPPARKQLEHVLDVTPRRLGRIIRSGSYGSWFNFYLCDLRINLDADPKTASPLDPLFSQLRAIALHDSSERCAR